MGWFWFGFFCLFPPPHPPSGHLTEDMPQSKQIYLKKKTRISQFAVRICLKNYATDLLLGIRLSKSAPKNKQGYIILKVHDM